MSSVSFSQLLPAVSWQNFALTFLGLYAIIVIRYFGIAGLFYWLLWKRPHNFTQLRDVAPDYKIIRSEISWSVVTSIIFALPGAYMIEAWKLGGTLLYAEPQKYGFVYMLFSLFLLMFLHDTYFYWTHRWMHRPKVFKIFHRVHHQSLNPTPWAAFSFHPSEGVIEALILPLLVFIIPVQVGVFLFALLAMTFFSVVNHTGYEIYPKSWMRGIWSKEMITPTHHNLHHKNFKANFGLYFRFWDRLMKTDVWPEQK